MRSELKNFVLLAWPLRVFALIVFAAAATEIVDSIRERRRRDRQSGL